jgi:hypothetical protein
MQNLYSLDTAFFGYDILFELIFFAITLTIAIFSFKIHKLSSQRESKLMGWGFLFFSLAYLFQFLFNLFILEELEEQVGRIVSIYSVIFFNYLGLLAHIIFYTLGLVLLLYVSFKTDNKQLMLVLFILSIFTVLATKQPLFIFLILSIVFLFFIGLFFFQNYNHNKNTKTLLIALAFIALLFSHVAYFISLNSSIFYIIGNLVEFVAYALILVNFYLVLKK